MKIRKIIGILVTLSIASTLTVPIRAYGDTTISVNAVLNDKEVTISILSDAAADERYSITVIDTNGTVENSFDNNEASVSNVYRMDQVSGNGNITYSFKLKENDHLGKYTVVIGGRKLSRQSKTIAYFLNTTDEITKQALADLNAASEDNINNVISDNADQAWIVDAGSDIYNNNKPAFAKILINEKGNGYENEADVESAFEFAERLVKISKASNSDLSLYFKIYKDALRCTVPQEFLNGQDEYIEAFANLKADTEKYHLLSAENLNELLNLYALPLGKLNQAARSDIINVLNQYSSTFDINLSNMGYTDSMEYDFAKAVAEKTFKNLEEVKIFVQTTINNIKNKQVTPSGVRSHGGSTSTGIGSAGNISKDEIESTRQTAKIVFNDVPDTYWAKTYIEYLAYNEIMIGDGKQYFRPSDNITREEFVSLLVKVMKFEPATSKSTEFSDVYDEQWYFPSINTAVANKICSGMEDGIFGIGRTITRQDAVTMIYNAKNAKEILLKKQETDINYTDSSDFAEYAFDIIYDISKTGIIKGYGDGTFRPNDSLTRAEAAKMMYSLIDLVYGLKNGGKI
ncbi:MAG: S-layer homology domain-containing protein [Firmicutes bacterium]|nr:S-layer homology domain-containing protein [Bacillota bacterium]